MSRFGLSTLIVFAATALMLADSALPPLSEGLTVHEWGTFTSIAGENGMADTWMPLDGPTDLPCFVHRFESGAKPDLSGTVRMETPVIYLYGSTGESADVRVEFPHGFITEWYPRANRVATYLGSGRPPKGPDVRQPKVGEPDSIEWPLVELQRSGLSGGFPAEKEASRYYAARNTDAPPLLVGGDMERFLFYRGVGRFQPPVAASSSNEDQVVVRNLAKDPIPAAILFENHAGRISYRMQGAIDREAVIGWPHVAAGADSLRDKMEELLVARGLFPKEARAMLATWGDSWFEEGTRLFYFLPASAIDSILPMRVEPEPQRVARVFVGRVEIFTPAAKKAIIRALEQQDWSPLAKYGRFLEPIIAKMSQGLWSHQVGMMRAQYLHRESRCPGASGW